MKDRIAKCYCRNMFWVLGPFQTMIVCTEIKQEQPQDRKTIFETLSLSVAKILSPVARQAPTKFREIAEQPKDKSLRRTSLPLTSRDSGRKKYTPPPWRPSVFSFSGSEALWCIPFFPDLWCTPFSLVSQENGMHHSFFCPVTPGSGDRPRKEGSHGGGV